LASQKYVRDCKIPRVHPSIRDFVRGMQLYHFFLDPDNKVEILSRDKFKSEDEKHWQSLLMAVAVAYYFRLPDYAAPGFEKLIDSLMVKHKCPLKMKFPDLLDSELSFMYGRMQIPQGIAKTKSLQINLFCNVVAMQARIPLLITGEPGRSKTLSFNIACDNMKGPRAKSQTFKKLKNVNR